jgi:hypothetical protein
VLIPQKVAAGIADGSVTVQFRWWKRPTVKAGGTLRSRVGVLAIEAVEVIEPDAISDADARDAGYADRDAAVADQARYQAADRRLYRVRFRRGGVDPRVALRIDDRLDAEALANIEKRLDGMDRRSQRGPWTRRTLQLIRDSPGVRAADLAEREQLETIRFKTDVRKLKELGLTESLNPGYRLSPRGEAYLRRMSR